MLGRFILAFSIVVWVLLGTPSVAQQHPSFQTLEDAEPFIGTYYQKPRPDLIADLIEALPSIGLIEKPNAVPPYIGFFSEVFRLNPSRVPEWQAVIGKQQAPVKQILGRALALSQAGGVTTIEGHSASLNDAYWGAFGASGSPAVLQKLVDQLRYCDERDDEGLFFAGATAKWSLASTAATDGLVRSTLAGHSLTADQRTRALITELLTQPPAQIKQEMFEVVKAQRAAGKWP